MVSVRYTTSVTLYMEETSFILQIANQWSYTGIFLLSFIANTFPGIPEELFVLAIGYLGSTEPFAMKYIFPIALIGLFLSDLIIFWLSKKGSKFYQKIIYRIFGVDADKITHNKFAQKHIRKIIFISRFVFQLRFVGPFLAGYYKVKWHTFMLYDLLALALYLVMMLFIGSYFHERISALIEGVGVVKNAILIFVALILLILIIRWARKNLKSTLVNNKHVRKATSALGFTKVDDDETNTESTQTEDDSQNVDAEDNEKDS